MIRRTLAATGLAVAIGYPDIVSIANTTINSLTLNQYGGTAAAGPIPEGTILTVTSGGIIAQPGNAGCYSRYRCNRRLCRWRQAYKNIDDVFE